MLIVYLSVLVGLWLVQKVVRFHVGRLERRFVRVAAEADEVARLNPVRPGNSNRPDPLLAARQQYELAQLAVKRDRVEKSYAGWQSFNERFAAFRGRLAGYQGKVVPYLFGVLDLAGTVVLLDWLGMNLANVRTMAGL